MRFNGQTAPGLSLLDSAFRKESAPPSQRLARLPRRLSSPVTTAGLR